MDGINTKTPQIHTHTMNGTTTIAEAKMEAANQLAKTINPNLREQMTAMHTVMMIAIAIADVESLRALSCSIKLSHPKFPRNEHALLHNSGACFVRQDSLYQSYHRVTTMTCTKQPQPVILLNLR